MTSCADIDRKEGSYVLKTAVVLVVFSYVRWYPTPNLFLRKSEDP